jgi:hypothetical protein
MRTYLLQTMYCWKGGADFFMGFTASLYQVGQGVLHAEEIISGDPLDPQNTFRFDRVELNLPGSSRS